MGILSRMTHRTSKTPDKAPKEVKSTIDASTEYLPNPNWVADYVANRDFTVEPIRRISEKPFRFSIVSAVYNTEKYLAECIESIIHQSLDFIDNTQIILVNDGSLDGSGEIAKKYARLFPDNIIYIEQDNSGVSSARNHGIKYATGKFLNFIDSDDIWSQDAFEQITSFFDAHPSLTLVSVPRVFFGTQTGLHPLSRILQEDAVIDITTYVGQVVNSASTTFFKRDAFPEEGFDESMSLGEDYYLVSTLLLAELKFGWAAKPTYWYRKHGTDSALGQSVKKSEFYSVTPHALHERIFKASKDKFGKVLPYFQYAIMYDLQWRLQANKNGCNPPEGLDSYKEIIKGLLREIDSKIILNQGSMSPEVKIYALSLKYDVEPTRIVDEIFRIQNDICWTAPTGDILTICKISAFAKMWVEFMDYNEQNKLVTLEGRLNCPLDISRIKLLAKWGDAPEEIAQAQLTKRFHNATNVAFEEDPILYKVNFKVQFPLESTSFSVLIDGVRTNQCTGFCKFAPFVGDNTGFIPIGEKLAYWSKDSFIPVEMSEKRLEAGENKIERVIRSNAPEEADHIIALRRAIQSRRSENRRIWMLSDRVTAGNDNGEALFEYLCKNPVPGVEVYFTINADAPDFERLSKMGNVVAYGSDEQVILTALAEVVASSAGEDRVFSPYGQYSAYFRDLLPKPKFVFLQHGITKDDASTWLHRWVKNIDLFVTAASREQESIVSNPHYGYGKDVARLTGFPRYDKLLLKASRSEKPKQIMISPTWRTKLAETFDSTTGTRPKYPGFNKSDYFQFFNSLINDKRLEETAIRLGYSIKFIVHPSFKQELDEFTSPFCEIDCECNYSDEFVKSAVLVTDYSSIAFDFALLERPVIYTQTDRKSFFEGQVFNPGYFDYDDDGFGPICTSYEATVATLIHYMENPTMEDTYLKRKRDFFPEFECRCKNVVDAILDITKKG